MKIKGRERKKEVEIRGQEGNEGCREKNEKTR